MWSLKMNKTADCVFFKELLDPWPESWIAYVYESEIRGGWEPVLVQLDVVSIARTFSSPDLDIVSKMSGCDRSPALSGGPSYYYRGFFIDFRSSRSMNKKQENG